MRGAGNRPLWSLDDLERWSRSPQILVRSWVCWRLADQPPSTRGESLLTALLEDPDPLVRGYAAEALAEWAPWVAAEPLRRYVERATGHGAGYASIALARCGDRTFVPVALRLLGQALEDAGPGTGTAARDEDRTGIVRLLAQALAMVRSQPALAALRRFAFSPGRVNGREAVFEALVRVGTQADLHRAVRWYRLRDNQVLGPLFLAVAEGLGLARRIASLMHVFAQRGWTAAVRDVQANLERVESPRRLPAAAAWACPEEPEGASIRKWATQMSEFFADLTAAGVTPFLVPARRLVWLFAALADPSPGPGLRSDEAWLQESLLALAAAEMLALYGMAHRGVVQGTGLDDATRLWVWSLEVPWLPGRWEAEMLGAGPDLAGALGQLLATRPDGWAGRRTAELLRRLAFQYPGRGTAAIPGLLSALPRAGGNRPHVAKALAAHGAAAIPPIARRLHEAAPEEKAGLLTALSLVPVQGSLALIKRYWADIVAHDRQLLADVALALGDRSLLPLLRRAWAPGSPHLAGTILILASLHGTRLRPDEWPELLRDVLASGFSGGFSGGSGGDRIRERQEPYGAA